MEPKIKDRKSVLRPVRNSIFIMHNCLNVGIDNLSACKKKKEYEKITDSNLLIWTWNRTGPQTNTEVRLEWKKG